MLCAIYPIGILNEALRHGPEIGGGVKDLYGTC